VQVLKVPYALLFPLILMFCFAAVFHVFVMVLFGGAVGYLMRKFGYEPVPLVLAFALGPLLENNLPKALILSVLRER
jgi:putative tricarboxylic transport membrane protein